MSSTSRILVPPLTTSSFPLSTNSLDSINQIVLFVTQVEEIGLSSFQLYTYFKDFHSHLTTSTTSTPEQSTLSPSNSILDKLPKKTLKLTLSDVNQTRTWIGFEYLPIPWLQLNLPKGSKLRIKSAKVFKNMLLLTSENTTLLAKGPEMNLKEWVQDQLSLSKEKIKVEPPLSFASRFSDNDKKCIDPQCHRFLIERPKPEELLALEIPSLSNSSTTATTTITAAASTTLTTHTPSSSTDCSTTSSLLNSTPSHSNSTHLFSQPLNGNGSSSSSSTFPFSPHLTTTTTTTSSSYPSSNLRTTTLTTPLRSTTPVIFLESDLEDETIHHDEHDDWEDLELSQSMLAQLDDFDPSLITSSSSSSSSSPSTSLPTPVPPLLTIQEIQTTLLTQVRVQNVKISKTGTKVQRSPITRALESWVSIEDGTGSISIHFDSMVLPQFMNTHQFDVTRDPQYVIEFKKNINKYFQQGVILEKINLSSSQGNVNQICWKLVFN